MQYFAVDWLDVIGGEDAVNALINGALTGHTHDDRYYTKTEIDAGYARLSGGNNFTGNQSVTGNITTSGSILAAANGTQNIGSTTNYFGTLHVGTIRTAGSLILNTNGTGYGLISSGSNGFWDADTFTIRNSMSVARATFASTGLTLTGNIVAGAGTFNAALTQLTLKGTSAGSAASHLLSMVDSAGTAQAQIYCEGTSRKLSLMNLVTGASTVLGTNGADRLTIDASGLVTIGGGLNVGGNVLAAWANFSGKITANGDGTVRGSNDNSFGYAITPISAGQHGMYVKSYGSSTFFAGLDYQGNFTTYDGNATAVVGGSVTTGIVTAVSGFRTHTGNTGSKVTTNGLYCMADNTNGWTLQRQGSNGVIKACNIQETAGVCLDVSTDGTLAIKSRANAVDARLSVPGSFHTVTIGPADSTFGANMSAGNQLLFHSTAYGAKAAIGFNNSGAFQVNNVLLGPSSVFNQLTALLGYTYAPAFCTDATSGQEKGMFSFGGVLYLTVNRGNQLAVDGTGVSIAGLLTASGVITSGFRSLSANPTTLDIASNREQLVKNTTNGELRRWANDGGSMKSILYA